MDPETAALMEMLAAQQGGATGRPGEPTLDPMMDPMVANGMAAGGIPDPAMADPAQPPPAVPGAVGPDPMADQPGQMAAAIGQQLAMQAQMAHQQVDMAHMQEVQRLSQMMMGGGPQTFEGPQPAGQPAY
jgi:hypothetical protein